jgi:predicted DNA-binding protein
MSTKMPRRNIHLTPELDRRLQAYCAETGAPAAEVIRRALTQYLNAKESVDMTIDQVTALKAQYDSTVKAAWNLYRKMSYNSSEVVVIYIADGSYGTDTIDVNGEAPGRIVFRKQAPRWYADSKQPKPLTLKEWQEHVAQNIEP